jgi:transcriptional regulator with XRE-family HTH domain
MSKIGKNIKKIRTVKKLSQAAFAELFSLARPSVGAYEEGRAEPKIDTIIQMANYFNLSIDALLVKDLTINDLYRFDSLKKKSAVKSEKPEAKIRNISKNLNTRVVLFQKYLDYIHNFRNDDFIDNLPVYHFPEIKSVSARAFEVGDDSMSYENAGLMIHDFAICEKKTDSREDLNPGHIYVLVLENNILIRRLSEIKSKLRFNADNPDWRQMLIDPEETYEIWEVSCILTRNLHPPLQMNKRMTSLEEKVELLTRNLKNLEVLLEKNKPK